MSRLATSVPIGAARIAHGVLAALRLALAPFLFFGALVIALGAFGEPRPVAGGIAMLVVVMGPIGHGFVVVILGRREAWVRVAYPAAVLAVFALDALAVVVFAVLPLVVGDPSGVLLIALFVVVHGLLLGLAFSRPARDALRAPAARAP